MWGISNLRGGTSNLRIFDINPATKFEYGGKSNLVAPDLPKSPLSWNTKKSLSTVGLFWPQPVKEPRINCDYNSWFNYEIIFTVYIRSCTENPRPVFYIPSCTENPWPVKTHGCFLDFSLGWERICTLLVEPVPTACTTLSGTKYSPRSDFVARVTLRVANKEAM